MARFRSNPHLGSIPTDWDAKPLQAITPPGKRIIYGIVQAGPHVPDGVPYIRSTDVGARIDVPSLLRTSPRIAAKYKRSVVNPGDIVFSLRGNIGETSLVPPDLQVANLTQGTARIAVDSECSNEFIRYALDGFQVRRRIAAVAKGSTFREITIEDLRKIVVPIPALPEQKRIAAILSTWDQAINSVRHLIDKGATLRRGLMRRLLTGKWRLPGFAGPWRQVRIGDVLAECDRPVDWKEDEVYRLVSVRRWAGGLFVREELYGREIKVKALKTIRAGDVLISHIQSAYGAMGLVGPGFDGYKVSDLYAVLVPQDPAAFDIRFFAYLTQRREMWHNAYLASNGFFAERLRLNFQPPDFLKRHIRIPPTIDEQRRIIAILGAADREIDLLRRELDLLRKQKRGLMQKLLTGQIRVKT